MSNMINRLLSIPIPEPETQEVELPRLGLTVTLQELNYDKVVEFRGKEDSSLHYLLASIVSPNFRDPAWFQDKCHCPTPVLAMKKLLRIGEVEALCRAADRLNGYGPGNVKIVVEETVEAMEGQTLGAVMEELEKN